MVKFKIQFDERIPTILTIIKGANPYDSDELADMFEKYLKAEYDIQDDDTVKDVYETGIANVIDEDFDEFLNDWFGISNFLEIYTEDYGFHYDDNCVSFKFNLLD